MACLLMPIVRQLGSCALLGGVVAHFAGFAGLLQILQAV
jgi:hypothetical protein